MTTTHAQSGNFTAPLLLVDDDPDDLWLVTRSLCKACPWDRPLTVACATTGSEALRYLDARLQSGMAPPGLILLDINMPGLSGIETLIRLRTRPALAGVTVVFLTTADDPRSHGEALRAGADAVIAKPDTVAALDAFAAHVFRTWLREDPAPPQQISAAG